MPLEQARQDIGGLHGERRQTAAALQLARRRVREQVRPALREINAAEHLALKAARQAAAKDGLYWGNYNAVLEAFAAAAGR